MKIHGQVLFAGDAYRALYDYHAARPSDLSTPHTETLICARIAEAAATRMSVPYTDALAVVKTVYAANRPKNVVEFFRFNNLWRIVTALIEHPSMQPSDEAQENDEANVKPEDSAGAALTKRVKCAGPPVVLPPLMPPVARK